MTGAVAGNPSARAGFLLSRKVGREGAPILALFKRLTKTEAAALTAEA